MTTPATLPSQTANEPHSSRSGLEIKLLHSLQPSFPDRAWGVTVHSTRPLLAACAADTTVRIYSLAALAQVSTISGGHKRSIRTCAWKPVHGSKSSAKFTGLEPLDSAPATSTTNGPTAPTSDPTNLATSASTSAPDESKTSLDADDDLAAVDLTLATGSFDASVGIWRRERGADFSGEPNRAESALAVATDALLGDERDSAALDATDEVEEWRYALVLDGHTSEVKGLTWSAAGNLLATCGRDKSVWIWEEVGEDDYETVAVLQEHGGDVKCVAWHPAEELLASASYDDDIRLWKEDVDDWTCVALLQGHTGTVWMVVWEGLEGPKRLASTWHTVGNPGNEPLAHARARRAWLDDSATAGPRLASCSEDGSIRIWRRTERSTQPTRDRSAPPSVMAPRTADETWVEEARLPSRHALAVYAIAWSAQTGLLASVGADGKIVIYREEWPAAVGLRQSTVQLSPYSEETLHPSNDLLPSQSENTLRSEDNLHSAADAAAADGARNGSDCTPQWKVVAELEAGHGVFEINHVSWAPRADRGRRYEGEEVLVTAGDDGGVKLWVVDQIA